MRSANKWKQLKDADLLHDLARLVRQDRENTAALVACIAEVDERRLYLPAGYSSMHAYCVGELHLSEDAAYKRIRAARMAKSVPALFAALGDGRIHLTAICILAPVLTPANADELITAASHKGRAEIELWLAGRFPRAEELRLDDGIAALPDKPQVMPTECVRGAGESSVELAPGRVEIPTHARVAPLSPERFAVQITISKETHDKLRHAQALLGHAVPSGEVALVLDRALDALIVQLEKRKCAATDKPRGKPRPAASRRHIPASVRRAVWKRDGGRCTFVGEGGRVCGVRSRLEFDHVDPVARGGRATADRMRLRCRAHNQFEAERVFGAGFMKVKRARLSKARASAPKPVARIPTAEATQLEHPTVDGIAGLRGLGVGAAEAKRVAMASLTGKEVTIEERMRAALRFLRPATARVEIGVRRGPERAP